MNNENLELIKEINQLWDPVYPYLCKHIQEVYGRKDGNILEIGPFCGAVFSLAENNIGNSFCIASFPSGMSDFFRQEAEGKNVANKVRIVESNPSLSNINDSSIDLVIFRGAFFFPSLGQADVMQIYRILKDKGVAFVGGGFGKYTPEEVIIKIGERSRDLNASLGKIHITKEKVTQMIQPMKVQGKIHLISEGGLWVVMKK